MRLSKEGCIYCATHHQLLVNPTLCETGARYFMKKLFKILFALIVAIWSLSLLNSVFGTKYTPLDKPNYRILLKLSVVIESGYLLKRLEKSMRARKDSFITRIFTDEVNKSSSKFLNSYLPKPLKCKGKVADPKKWPNDIFEHYKQQYPNASAICYADGWMYLADDSKTILYFDTFKAFL